MAELDIGDGGIVHIYYHVGLDGKHGRQGIPSCLLRRQEALSLSGTGARERIALHEALSLLRLGVADHLWVPNETHLGDSVTSAVVCAEVMACGKSITIGKELIALTPEPGTLPYLACEAARERHRLMAAVARAGRSDVYISPGWPSDEECARLAHKLVYEMGYSQAHAARIFEVVDGYERPAVWTRQGVNRLLWEEIDGERYPRFHFREKSGEESRREGRQHLLGASMNLMAVVGGEGAESSARKYDASLDEPHHLVQRFGLQPPDIDLTRMLWNLDLGCIRTLYVTNPEVTVYDRS